MKKPHNLKTKIFLDGGDPRETREIIALLGFLDGQTTNPTLIAKSPDAKKRLAEGKKFTEEETTAFYRGIVHELSGLIPDGSISIEVYADRCCTSSDAMLKQGREMFSWIKNAHIKYPTTAEGLAAAEQSVREEMRVNMTLCFTEEQAAAVYAATRGAKAGGVFVSPFVGRLDDIGENGMDLIENILRLYRAGDGHAEVLSASVRNMQHFMRALELGSDIITAPFSILKEWGEKEMPIPGKDFSYAPEGLRAIPYRDLDLSLDWKTFPIAHPLTDKGIDRFSEDWNALIEK